MSKSAVVLVTGASGFVGSAVASRILKAGLTPRATSRRSTNEIRVGADVVRSGDLDSDFDWGPVVDGCDAVVHAAARVHVIRDPVIDPLSQFRRVNVTGTLRLATQAAAAGVRRFIF